MGARQTVSPSGQRFWALAAVVLLTLGAGRAGAQPVEEVPVEAAPAPASETSPAPADSAPAPASETVPAPADPAPAYDPGSAQYSQTPGAVLPPATEADEAKAGLRGFGALGGQWFWVQQKVMPSVLTRLTIDRYSFDLETAFIYLTERSPDFDGVFLGNEIGAYLNAAPISMPKFELRAGVGGDFYYLWAVNGDELQAALSVKLAAHFWPLPRFGLFASVRSYVVSGPGLELGTTRDGDEGVPILFATGFELRTEVGE